MSAALITVSDRLPTVGFARQSTERRNIMRTRITTAVAPIAAIAALAVGGVAYASSGGSAAQNAKATATAMAEPVQSGADSDNIQSGDQTTPDTTSNAQ